MHKPTSTYCCFKSSCPEVFCEKDVLRNFAKILRETLVLESLVNKATGLSLQLY